MVQKALNIYYLGFSEKVYQGTKCVFLFTLQAVIWEPGLWFPTRTILWFSHLEHVFSKIAKEEEKSWSLVHGMYLQRLSITFSRFHWSKFSLLLQLPELAGWKIQANCVLKKQNVGLVKSEPVSAKETLQVKFWGFRSNKMWWGKRKKVKDMF